MTQSEAKQLLILAARADYLAQLRERKRISEEEYMQRLNELRRQCGLAPIEIRSAKPGAALEVAWQS